jgi:hypothetical protein
MSEMKYIETNGRQEELMTKMYPRYKKKWEEDEIALLREEYSVKTEGELESIFGRPYTAIKIEASQKGIPGRHKTTWSDDELILLKIVAERGLDLRDIVELFHILKFNRTHDAISVMKNKLLREEIEINKKDPQITINEIETSVIFGCTCGENYLVKSENGIKILRENRQITWEEVETEI